uniref:Uncharacterized protein n=1 Tax=Anguilla anguilla TaxID=7936 RepID=A0A0E9UNL7_ANGAN
MMRAGQTEGPVTSL